jgi:hypothetical protein
MLWSCSVLLEYSHSGNLRWDLIIKEIRRLKMKEPRAHVAMHIGLIVVVA